MIQLNLLPDVKIAYIKAKRTRRLLATISIVSAATSLVVAILLFLGVNIIQKNQMENLNTDIAAAARTVRSTPDVDRIITVQNQLNSLPGLHQTKPAATRMFDYLSKITPANVTLSKVTADFTANTMVITGNSADLLGVNKFTDTIKFTTYKVDNGDSIKAFNNVLLSQFATANPENTDSAGASYEITLAYDPAIFDNQQKIELAVPATVSTRSQVNASGAIFQADDTNIGGQ